MDGQEQKPEPGTDDAEAVLASIGSVGMSRRDFTRRVGAGSAAAVGLVWAAPKISTIRYAVKAKAGSPPPTTTTTTTVPIGPEGGTISVSTASPCVGDTIRVVATGFAPKTAVTLELDSAADTLGVTTADAKGKVDVQVELAANGPTGAHNLRAVGVQSGGKTLSLSAPLVIKTAAECAVGPQGTTTIPGTSTTIVTPTTIVTTPTTSIGPKQVVKPPGSGSLAFTGTDAIDLALIGGAAAIGGRALYGLARRRDDEDDEDDE
jgi:hypothetical protein